MKVDGAPVGIGRPVRRLNDSDAQHILDAKRKESSHPQNELQWELRSDGQSDEMETTDLQDELNKKIPNLRAKLKRRKTNSPVDKLEPIILYQRKNPDLRTRLNFLRAERTARPKEQPQRLNVILGGSPLAKILSGP
ncbi:hypothetical protein Bca4012_038725 [Brassica carinata]